MGGSGDKLSEGDWVRFNEFEDVLSSLQALELHLDQFRTENASWKWIVLAAHSALQGSCVCFLTHTDGSEALTTDCEKALREYYDSDLQKSLCDSSGISWHLGEIKSPESRVAPLPELLKRLPEPLSVQIPKDFSSKPTGKTYRILKLHTLRNGYTHFESISHSIDVSGMKGMIEDVLDTISGIVNSSDWKRRNKFSETNVLTTISGIRNKLNDLEVSRNQSRE